MVWSLFRTDKVRQRVGYERQDSGGGKRSAGPEAGQTDRPAGTRGGDVNAAMGVGVCWRAPAGDQVSLEIYLVVIDILPVQVMDLCRKIYISSWSLAARPW